MWRRGRRRRGKGERVHAVLTLSSPVMGVRATRRPSGAGSKRDDDGRRDVVATGIDGRVMVAGTWKALWSGAAPVVVTFVVVTSSEGEL